MKRPIKKAKRFSEGGFSEAQEKWLGGADRTDPAILARMRRAVPDEVKAEPKEEVKPTVIESSEETGNKGTAVETIKAAPPKAAPPKAAPPKPAAPKAENKVVAKTEDKEEPKVKGKTFSETIAASKSKDQDKPKTKQETAADIAKIQRENIAGPDKNLPAPEPKSTGKRFREFFGSKYKEGGTVKRSSASSRADGCAIRGKTRA